MVCCILVNANIVLYLYCTFMYCHSIHDALLEGIPVGSMYLYFGHWVTMPIPLLSIPINVLKWIQGLPSVWQSIFVILSIRLSACYRIFIYFFAYRVSMDTTDTLDLVRITICIYIENDSQLTVFIFCVLLQNLQQYLFCLHLKHI